MSQFQENCLKKGQTDRRMDGRKDRPQFIRPFLSRPGVQKDETTICQMKTGNLRQFEIHSSRKEVPETIQYPIQYLYCIAILESLF